MKFESLKMNLQSLKSQSNNEKGIFSKGKTTKSTTTFMQNKPNFKNIKIGLSSLETSKYEILPAGSGEKTNPIKPNTKPICGMAKFALSSFMTSKYVKFKDLAGEKTNPKQSQFKAKKGSMKQTRNTRYELWPIHQFDKIIE